ncbi:MAG TPA: hypothetical protein VJG64_00215 [Candidatus Paceibacterota bacterium]
MDDLIPTGSFSVDLTAEELRAIQLVEVIGNRLATEFPEIADLYRSETNSQRYIDIAIQYFGSEAEHYPGVYAKAVGFAIRKLIPPEEQRLLTSRRRAKRLGTLFGGFDSAAFKQHSKRAAARRHELHGPDTDAMTRGRGMTPWSKVERAIAIQKRQEGVSFPEIAEILNRDYHDGKPIRTAKRVADTLKYEAKRKQK